MVSIIIPCYNLEDYVSETINSVLTQNDGNWEIIAIDDGSTDTTWSVLKNFANVDKRIKVFHQENQGVSSARNRGTINAKGDWIYFLDGDDIIEPDLVGYLNSMNEDIDFALFDFLIEGSKGKKRIYRNNTTANLLSHFLINTVTICMCSFAVRARFVKSHKLLFDSKTFYGEDREFIAKVLSFSPKIKKINEILFRCQQRDGSAMANKVYSERRFSSVLACERTYKSLVGRREEKAAHTNLAFTIVRHLKMYYEYRCQDDELSNKLWEYAGRYLITSGFGFGKVEIYTFLARVLYKDKKLLKAFLKLY